MVCPAQKASLALMTHHCCGVQRVDRLTRLQAGSRGLHALWLLPIKHHQDELQAVDADVQHRPSAQLLFHGPLHVQYGHAEVGPHVFDLAYFALGQQPPDLSRGREESGPHGLKRVAVCRKIQGGLGSHCGCNHLYLHQEDVVLLGGVQDLLHFPAVHGQWLLAQHVLLGIGEDQTRSQVVGVDDSDVNRVCRHEGAKTKELVIPSVTKGFLDTLEM